MKKIAIAFLAATSIAAFGCKKKGGSGEAMELMKTYKAELCACKDHDPECGKKATDNYQKASADLAAKNPSEKMDTSAKPDPEMEKLTTEVADCSKRVMTPAMDTTGGGAAGGAAAGSGSDMAAPAGGEAPAAGSGSGEAAAAGGSAAGGGSGEPAAAGSGSAK